MKTKEVGRLTPSDLREHPIWRFTGNDSPSETLVLPIKRYPLKSLAASLVGIDVVLACGKKKLALIGNIEVTNPRYTQHFLTLSIYRDDGAIFHLARYHDVDASERGPTQLAAFLGMKKEEIFPIAWDVSPFAFGDRPNLRGIIEAEPRERLTRDQIIALAVP